MSDATIPGHHGAAEDRAAREEAAEREALGKIVLAFREYRRFAELEIGRWELNFAALPPRHKALLQDAQLAKFGAARRAAIANQRFLATLINSFDDEDEVPPHLAHANAAGDEVASASYCISHGEADKIKYVLKNLVRDWAAEGAEERARCYGPILQELRNLYSSWPADAPEPPRVLLPGAGLARLCCEVAGLGLQAQGNEFSYHMLLASSFMLNEASEAGRFSIHPWLLSNCNQLSDEEQLRAVGLPDVAPADIVAGPGLLSMCAGDFVEVYSREENRGVFDSVVTCFFIDTAHNVVEYLEVIHRCLRKGGHWINLGPLLYHWAESAQQDDLSIELSLAEIKRVATAMGFRLLRERTVDAPYMASAHSMFRTVYQACFWTMVKEEEEEGNIVLEEQPVPPPPPPHRRAL